MIETSGQSNEPIRVAIAEDDRAMREGLGMLISGAPGYACAGEFRSVEVAMRSLGRQQPDVLLLDIQLPGMPGSEGVRVSREGCVSQLMLPGAQVMNVKLDYCIVHLFRFREANRVAL